MILGISPGEHQMLQLALKKKYRITRLAFILLMFLPFIVFFLFFGDVFGTKKAFSTAERDELFKPICRVETGAAVGTAFLVGNSTLLTARHVLEGMETGDQVNLVFDKAPELPHCEAVIEWYPEVPEDEVEALLADMAVLRLSNPGDIPSDFPRLALGASYMIKELDEVIVVGYASGDFTVTEGGISNTSAHGIDLFKLDVEAYHGQSGGPLISKEYQKVVGMVIAGLTEDQAGLNLAIKIDNVFEMLYNEGIDPKE